MTHIEEAKVAAVIQTIAARENKAPEEIRRAMQEALDAAWTAAWTPGISALRLSGSASSGRASRTWRNSSPSPQTM